MCANANQKWWLSGTSWSPYNTGGGKLRTLSLPLAELSKMSLQIKLQMKNFGWAKLCKPASVCDVCLPVQDRSCLEVGAENAKRSWNNWGALTTAQAPREPRLQRPLQPRERTQFFGSDWYLLQKPCLPNKLTFFSNLHLPWPKDCCLLTGQKLSHFSTCVTWTWGEFKLLIIWVFHVVFSFTSHHFPFYFDLTSSTLTFQSHLSLSL